MVTQDDNEPAGHAGKHATELEAVYSITRILVSDVNQRQMLEEVLDVLDRDLGMKRATIMLLSPDGSELIFEVAHNLSPRKGRGVRYRSGEGITGKVVQSNKPAVVPRKGAPKQVASLFAEGNQSMGEDLLMFVDTCSYAPSVKAK